MPWFDAMYPRVAYPQAPRIQPATVRSPNDDYTDSDSEVPSESSRSPELRPRRMRAGRGDRYSHSQSSYTPENGPGQAYGQPGPSINPMAVSPQRVNQTPEQPIRSFQMPVREISVPTLVIGSPATQEVSQRGPYIFPLETETAIIQVFHQYGRRRRDGRWVTIPPMSVTSFKQRMTSRSHDNVSLSLEWPNDHDLFFEKELVAGPNIVDMITTDNNNLPFERSTQPYLVVYHH